MIEIIKLIKNPELGIRHDVVSVFEEATTSTTSYQTYKKYTHHSQKFQNALKMNRPLNVLFQGQFVLKQSSSSRCSDVMRPRRHQTIDNLLRRGHFVTVVSLSKLFEMKK